jgi:hypothetical protein
MLLRDPDPCSLVDASADAPTATQSAVQKGGGKRMKQSVSAERVQCMNMVQQYDPP